MGLVILISFLMTGCGQIDSTNNSPCKKIVFVLGKEDYTDIYSICPDGSNLIKLTDSTSVNNSPAWSPGGERIAFSSARNGIYQIFVMNANGSNKIQLTSDYQSDHPVWLPDGEQIAFRTTDTKGLWWWRIIDIETKEITVFSEPSYDFFFQTPAWSPDGQRIAYMSLVEQEQRNDGSSQIHVKNVDGSNDVALTNDIWANINPIWSPDGEKIAFLSERDGTYYMFALYVMSADGQDIQKLSDPIYSENNKYSWSPDGTEIAIDSQESVRKIYIIDLNSGQKRELLTVNVGEYVFSPSWQP
jgi:Tol biopolymer transport system component